MAPPGFLFTKILILSNQRRTALFKTNKNVNFLGKSTAGKRLGVSPHFFQVKGKYLDYCSAVMIHKVLHTWIELQAQGHSPENGLQVCVAPKTPFSCLLAVCKTPCISPCFSSQDPTFSLISQISRNFKLQKSPTDRGNIQFGNLKLGQNQFTWQHFVQIFSSEGSQINSAVVSLHTNPCVMPFQLHNHSTQMKVECHPWG